MINQLYRSPLILFNHCMIVFFCRGLIVFVFRNNHAAGKQQIVRFGVCVCGAVSLWYMECVCEQYYCHQELDTSDREFLADDGRGSGYKKMNKEIN